MGYSTRYELTWAVADQKLIPRCEHSKPKDAKFCPECGRPAGFVSPDEQIAEYIGNNSEMNYAIDENGDTRESCKWYEHEKDMREMSKKFPDVLFTLRGEGEESGDIWLKYFLNGKCQTAEAKISFDEFDLKKLT